MSATPTDPADAPTYEEARDELVGIVRMLETGGTTLTESLALWERGEELARICQAVLDGARERIEAVLDPANPDDVGATEADRTE